MRPDVADGVEEEQEKKILIKKIEEFNMDALKSVFFIFLKSMFFQRYLKWKYIDFNLKITNDDFKCYRIIGKGAFGEVYGMQKKDTGQFYAVKSIDKRYLKKKKKESLALNERRILTKCRNPFVINLAYAYQSK
eukprot:Pgem_evm1s10865